jgi:hypothetical protein
MKAGLQKIQAVGNYTQLSVVALAAGRERFPRIY